MRQMKRLAAVPRLLAAGGIAASLFALTSCAPKPGAASGAEVAAVPSAPGVPAAPGAPMGERPTSASDLTALQMALGNPDKATGDAANREHFLIKRPQYALSYNDGLGFPNWAAWRLVKSEIGNQERGQFKPDPVLPSSFQHITTSDYSGSGYDRGHNCPSKDRSDKRGDNDAVFYMSNITPQAHGMNAGPWEQLESYSRDLTGQNELFIYCGHGFEKGTPRKLLKTRGSDKIYVPTFGWKIIVVVPNGVGSPVSRITPTTRVIAVRMKNISTISKQDWREFRTSVEDIEQATGLVFFDTLPKATADALKNRVDYDKAAPSKAPKADKKSDVPKDTKQDTKPAIPPANAKGMVWVNLKSGVFWRPGTPFYGKTKEGKFLTEADALKAGYRAARGQ